jgi:hypothetical protein
LRDRRLRRHGHLVHSHLTGCANGWWRKSSRDLRGSDSRAIRSYLASGLQHDLLRSGSQDTRWLRYRAALCGDSIVYRLGSHRKHMLLLR